MVQSLRMKVAALGFVSGSFVLLAAGSAHAANPDFRISYQALKFENTATKTKTTQDGSDTSIETEQTVSTYTTFPADSLEIAAFLGTWSIYGNPTPTGGTLTIGYNGIPNFEIAPSVSLHGSSSVLKDKETSAEIKNSDAAFAIGVSATYTLNVGFSNLDLTLAPVFKSSTEKRESGETAAAAPSKTETTTSQFDVGFDASLGFAIAENFDYAPGINVNFTSGTKDTKDVQKEKFSALKFGVNIAKFRYNF